MNISNMPFRHFASALVATLVLASGAMAATPSAVAEAQARYREDMKVCNSGQSNQDQATCRREAGSALAEAKRGALNDVPGQYHQNALQRCVVHKDDEDRRACEARVNGQGTSEGSVAAGGVLYQSVTVTPAK
ncbi:MAG: hypothetical protein CO105_15245 [Comamonadaceae bacterium CG_4_9_14_3_um_filter_60_33]|nr:MAG: hypothetical protein AUK51_15575 [Comamonadaceae bacterium CG2_30_59_20]PIY28465.1 MAG: hypothetical protein COZ09_09745 [Comamonadaceae bacterium CG_4_10_14_3_um_filter_60_42]PJB40850.1 MAG: hypothetical protein CO105_15245 [Comamonadaceae bacterium CG_4_9_14_3_um_filter_60_33]